MTAKHVLILKTVAADMTALSDKANGFRWPEKGPVAAPDWDPTPECGGGLHGLLWGEGDGTLLSWDEDARWIVFRAPAATVVEIGGKVKVPGGTVVHVGDRLSATSYLLAHGAAGRAVVGATATAGDYGTATAGYRGTATAGDYGTATAGDYGTIVIRHWDGARYRLATGYVGEGIEAGVPYRVTAGKLEAVR